MLNIRPTDRVLEVGSGNRPRKRSDVLCDKFTADNTERAGGDNLVIDTRPFVVADGVALPFKDKSFDYVVTSHILEHVDDPYKFADELSRVAKAGYIETPSELGEKIFGWPFHKWIVRFEDDTIVMSARTAASPFGNYFHEMYAHDLNFAEFVDSHFQDFYVQCEWEDKIKLRMEQDPSTDVNFNREMRAINTRTGVNSIGLSFFRPISTFFLRVLRHFRRFER